MFKNFKLIGIVCLIMAAMVAFSSCSKEQQIVGKWKITKAKINGENRENDEGETWIFKEGGKCILHFYSDDYEGTYSVKKNTLSVDVEVSRSSWKDRYYGDLDLDEFNKNEMAVSGTLKNTFYEEGYGSESNTEKFNFEFKKM